MIILGDFETTGLDTATVAPIEFACLVLDDAFKERDGFSGLIQPTLPPEKWDPYALEMHKRSGLYDLCTTRGLEFNHFSRELYRFLRSWVPPAATGPELHFMGNSIGQFDFPIMRRCFPVSGALFHHRVIDVSTLRMVGERITVAERLGGEPAHRAMDDVRRSYQELQHWVKALRHSNLKPTELFR